MNAKYFNKFEFKKALDLTETDPLSARNLYEQYFEKYPKDYSAYPFYCSVLIMLGEFELAEKILNFIENISKEDTTYNEIKRIENFSRNVFHTRIQLLSYQERYEELYQFCIDNIKRIKDKNMNSVLFYSKKKIGRLDLDKRNSNSYLFKQMVRYEEKDFLEHIKKHLSEYNQNEEVRNKNIFVPNFPIISVLDEIKKYIPSTKRLFIGLFDNVYFFKYDGCGRENNKIVDYIKVICFHNTNEFITMCPVSGSENLPYVDLNYLIEKDENIKIKRISQIDKFNQKYNRK